MKETIFLISHNLESDITKDRLGIPHCARQNHRYQEQHMRLIETKSYWREISQHRSRGRTILQSLVTPSLEQARMACTPSGQHPSAEAFIPTVLTSKGL